MFASGDITIIEVLSLADTLFNALNLSQIGLLDCLEVLDLQNAKGVDDESIQKLKVLKRLKVLTLAGNGISPEAAKELLGQLPSCQIIGVRKRGRL